MRFNEQIGVEEPYRNYGGAEVMDCGRAFRTANAANVVTLVREDTNRLSWGLVRTIRTEDWWRTGLGSSDGRSLESKMEKSAKHQTRASGSLG